MKDHYLVLYSDGTHDLHGKRFKLLKDATKFCREYVGSNNFKKYKHRLASSVYRRYSHPKSYGTKRAWLTTIHKRQK